MKAIKTLAAALCTLTPCLMLAQSVTIPVHLLNKQDTAIGTVTASDTTKGLQLNVNLHGLPPGPHGFHIHVVGSCANKGMAAKAHLDPKNTGKHLGPYGNGHLGDLPRLFVNQRGSVTHGMIAPRLTVKDIEGHSLMIHLHGDNYSDQPKPLGGGGPRLACGVIPKKPA